MMKFTAEDKGKGKERDATSGNQLNERLAKILQYETPVDQTRPERNMAAQSSVTFPARGHHRRASSDGHVRTSSRDSGTIRASGSDWVLVAQDKDDNTARYGPAKKTEDGRIVPTPIRQRDPPASFSVTSRPQHPERLSISVSPPSGSTSPSSPAPMQPRQRSSTMAPAGSPPRSGIPSGVGPAGASVGLPRQRSSTLMPYATPSPAPAKPFAERRRESPASSTGDSSSGRAPLTPRDGSDLSGAGVPATVTPGDKEKDGGWGSGVSGLGVGKGKGKGHGKRLSVNFEEDVGKKASRDDSEMRRRERRRSEAKAAIEVCC